MTRQLVLCAVLFTAISICQADTLRLATTTSTESSGLLAYLFPLWEAETGHTIKYRAVGSGVALKLGREKEVEALLVHAPADEEIYMAQNHGVRRDFVFFNDFILVGPDSISGADSLESVLTNIVDERRPFVSRADNSGTHKKEQTLWQMIDYDPINTLWYIEAGQGMGATLTMADREQAYAIVDRGTWIAKGDQTSLKVVFENHPALLTRYSLIVNTKGDSALNTDLALQFAQWLISEKTQTKVEEYRINGKALYKPFAQF